VLTSQILWVKNGVEVRVDEKGGFMYAQLWHTGAMSHPDFFEGALPMSASAVNPGQESVTPSGRKHTVVPRPMSKAEIQQTVAEFGVAAKNALEAGFDGVQIQANYLYLIAQFLNSATIETSEIGFVVAKQQRRAAIQVQVVLAVHRTQRRNRAIGKRLEDWPLGIVSSIA
jgi:N-ethylmaleimide reductase